MAKLNQEIIAVNPHVNEQTVLQDLMALTAILSPLVICIGFFFTLRAKTLEVEKSLEVLTGNLKAMISNAHEILLLKFDARLSIFSERMDVLKEEVKENADNIKALQDEIKTVKQGRQDILNQLSKMGIDLYIVGENDRRRTD